MIILLAEMPGLRDLQGRFAVWDETLARYRRDEARRYMPKVLATLRRYAPVRTGVFRDSLTGRIVGRTRFTEMRFSSSDPKARFVMEPTRPHIIEARKTALRFADGIFRKRVMHPGTKGSRFVRRAYSTMAPEFIRVMNRVGEQAMVTMAGVR